jgi:hypothetical protein
VALEIFGTDVQTRRLTLLPRLKNLQKEEIREGRKYFDLLGDLE